MDLNINYEKKYIKYKKKYLKLKEELEGGKGLKIPKAKPKAQSPKAKPKAQSPKAQSPKAQSPKTQTPKTQTPKAQTPKKTDKKTDKKKHKSEGIEPQFNNIVENVAFASDTKIQAFKQLFANNNINLSDNFYTKINDIKDIKDIIEVVSNDPELQKYPNIKEQIYAIIK